MAFILDYLTSTRPADKADDVQADHLYRTTDTQATVIANNYFLNGKTLVPSTDTAMTASTTTQRAINRFYVGDVIHVQQVNSSGDIMTEYNVVVAYLDKGSDPLFIVELMNPGEVVAVGTLADISTASTQTVTFGQTVQLTSATFYLGGEITVADAEVKVSIGATDIPNCTATVAFSGSAKGDKYDVTGFGALCTGTAFIVTSDGASTTAQELYIVLRGKVETGDIVTVSGTLADISTLSTGYVAAPFAGTIQKVEVVLQTAITGADANVTSNINGVSITGGGGVVPLSGAAAGQRVVFYPTAANACVEGDSLRFATDGNSSTASVAFFTFYIKRS